MVLGHQQQVVEAFPECAIFAGSTTDGAWQEQFLHIHRAGQGLTQFGPLNKAAHQPENRERLQTLLNLDTLAALESDNIIAVLQQKLAINAAINGLTVLHNCRNGDLLKPELQPYVARLCQETEKHSGQRGVYPSPSRCWIRSTMCLPSPPTISVLAFRMCVTDDRLNWLISTAICSHAPPVTISRHQLTSS